MKPQQGFHHKPKFGADSLTLVNKHILETLFSMSKNKQAEEKELVH